MRVGGEVEDLLRRMAPQVLGALVRRYGNFDTAEDAVQEALLAASIQWPTQGAPDNPRGWLITVASRRLTDLLRSEQARRRREDDVARWELPPHHAGSADDPPSDFDDSLVLLVLCCHPALDPVAQIALTLRAVGGLSTAGSGGSLRPPGPGVAGSTRWWRCALRERGHVSAVEAVTGAAVADMGTARACALVGRSRATHYWHAAVTASG